jgi:putative heme-binding domain-containing protein
MQVVGRRGELAEVQEALNHAEKLASLDPKLTLEVRSTLWPALATALRTRGKPANLLTDAAASAGVDLNAILATAVETASDSKGGVPRRVAALRLLALQKFDLAKPAIRECLASSDSAVVSAAVAVAGGYSESGVAELLLENYSSRSPLIRREIQGAIFRSEPRIAALLDEIDAGRIAATELDQPRMQQLARVKNAELKGRAAKLIAANQPADRTEVIEKYQPALARKGDPAHGRELFTKNCAQCHRIGNIGVNVAPDISDSRVKQPSQLLTDVLDPNRAIDNNYFNYLVVDLDGTVHTGVIATETSTSITLRQPEDKRVTIARENIEQIKSTGQSLMPVGLEKTISVDDMSDLISFIKNWRYLDGEVPKEVIR